MRRFWHYISTHWIELLIAVLWLPSVVSALFLGNLLIIILTSFGGLFLLMASLSIMDAVERRRLRPKRGENVAFDLHRLGIVFTVGNQDFTVRFALHNQKPIYVGFLCTMQSVPVANRLIEEFALDSERVKTEVVDPWNIREVREKTESLLRWVYNQRRGQKLSRADIVVDVTGGLTTMSVGAFSVAEEWRVDSQYIRSQYQLNKPVAGSQEAILISRFTGLLAD